MWDYTDKVKDLYTDPKNVGSIEDADAFSEVGSIVCGDALKLYLKIDENEIITDAKFETFGCGSAIASSSALTEMVIGKTVAEAEKITNQDIVDFLGGLPEEKMHCSVMGGEALEKALNSWKGVETKDDEDTEGEVICQCFGVTDPLIRKVVRDNNLTSVEEITNYTKAGGACGSCIHKIEDILEDELKKKKDKTEKPAEPAGRPMTNLKRMQLAEETINNIIRPELIKDGGDIVLVDIDGTDVYVTLRGSCASCNMSNMTLTNFVESKLKEYVDDNIKVIESR